LGRTSEKNSQISLEFLFGIGIAARYLVKSQINVTAYSLPFSDLGSGPIVSTITLSKACTGE